ncbi:hypothetical protein RISK_002008 [Rhodopirellula islandica]|uniref:Uncharacterized protein n=1 Tax=Rhodopirellula islandica TaxID=595434 RepID=A0A0J1BHZ5_RHOIS|nr:hypothetical protein RISK_002008 [Rhodopirellula islandica]
MHPTFALLLANGQPRANADGWAFQVNMFPRSSPQEGIE